MRAGYFVMPWTKPWRRRGGLQRTHRLCHQHKGKDSVGCDLQSELVDDFFEGFARGARANVHLKTIYGRSNHHKIEALFKAFARALRVACSRDKQLAKMLPAPRALMIAIVDYGAATSAR